jgi:predicted flavoprotein YhiN
MSGHYLIRVAVIGGGASGIVAAIAAARKGADVTILEKNQRIGRKILATGNGRCNLTNIDLSITNFPVSNPHPQGNVIQLYGGLPGKKHSKNTAPQLK